MSMEGYLKLVHAKWVDVAVEAGYIAPENAQAAKADVVFISPSKSASARVAAKIADLASRQPVRPQWDIVSEDPCEASPCEDLRRTMLDKMLSQPLTHLRQGDVILKALPIEGESYDIAVGVWCRDADAKSAFLRKAREHGYEIRLVSGVETVFDKQRAFKVKVADDAVWAQLLKEMQYVCEA